MRKLNEEEKIVSEERRKQHNKEYCRIHREELKEYQKEYRQTHREKLREYFRQRWKEPKRKEQNREDYQRHKTERLMWHKKHRERPDIKEKHRLLDAIRYTTHKKEYQERGQKYRMGEITTPTIIKAEKNLSLIKEMYIEKNYDSISIAKKLKVSQDTIFAILRRNNISIKPKIFSNTKTLACSNGLLVKSNCERRIVEFLIKKNINFIYEPTIKYNGKTYFPDFYLLEKDLYIEYAGLTDKDWYNEQLEKKKQAYQELNLKVIFITKPEQICGVVI